MLGFSFLRRAARPDPLAQFYGDIVASARDPVAYRELGVADTFEGRFELLVLVATLALRRLKALPAPAGDVAQELVDRIFAGLDDGLRRAGIGDLSVPKRMKKLAQGFYGRLAAYDSALDAADEGALREALSRNLYGGERPPEAVPAAILAAIEARRAALQAADLEALLAGGVLVSSGENAA